MKSVFVNHFDPVIRLANRSGKGCLRDSATTVQGGEDVKSGPVIWASTQADIPSDRTVGSLDGTGIPVDALDAAVRQYNLPLRCLYLHRHKIMRNLPIGCDRTPYAGLGGLYSVESIGW